MKSAVVAEICTLHINNAVASPQAFSILSEAKDEDTRKRLDLLGLYNAAEKCLDKVDDKILHLLQQNVSNVQEKLHNKGHRITRTAWIH